MSDVPHFLFGLTRGGEITIRLLAAECPLEKYEFAVPSLKRTFNH